MGRGFGTGTCPAVQSRTGWPRLGGGGTTPAFRSPTTMSGSFWTGSTTSVRSHPGLKLNIPSWLVCMSWFPLTLSSGGHRARRSDRRGLHRSAKRAGTSLCTHKTLHKKAGPFSVARLKMDLPFHNRLAFTGEVPALLVRPRPAPPRRACGCCSRTGHPPG